MSISNQDQSIHQQSQSEFYLSLEQFASKLRETGLIHRLIQLAHDEDLAPAPGSEPHDWTGELMFRDNQKSSANLMMRQPGVIAGLAFIPDILEVFALPDHALTWTASAHDGQHAEQGVALGTLSGSAMMLVRVERTVLNLIARLSGIATITAHYVDLAQRGSVKICDTRKTTPGLRALEKYAVRCGGGFSHRMGLYDAMLIKDNHLAGLEESEFKQRVLSAASDVRNHALSFVQVEVDTLEQLGWVLDLPDKTIDLVLLDNMGPDRLIDAVNMRNDRSSSIELEASGGINESTLPAISKTGIDRVSIGALTHQAVSLDIGLDTL